MWPIALMLMIFPALIYSRDYCDVCSDHTMCKYKEDNPSEKCGKILARGATEEDKTTVLKSHNDLRSRLAQGKESRGNQPSAQNMLKLKWNSELAIIAQRWADQCVWRHDMCRHTDIAVGQNLYMSYSDAPLGNGEVFTAAAEDWWSEVNDFNKRSIDGFQTQKEMVGHYTQMAWADSSEIGCGYTYYKKGHDYTKYVVCNYGPAGNYVSRKMYIKGKPCGSCPAKTVCEESTKLCN